ncbi:unnamed protein product [Adineta steineri]|uniref:Uncharacterized protein n=1 Tax=Adineta steineri TaxID=433720 RepID=A0A818MIZ1_9BILA|nr:unnamed protein product [Adineta steineri]CAF3590138.1 unnamed protein product [Adineta steineri]
MGCLKQIDDIFINEDVSARFREILQNMTNICNDLFAILKKQKDDISHLKREMRVIQMSQDEILLESVATEIIIKMS